MKFSPSDLSGYFTIAGLLARIISIFLPWITIQAIYTRNETILSEETHVLGIVFDSSLTVGNIRDLSFLAVNAPIIIALLLSGITLATFGLSYIRTKKFAELDDTQGSLVLINQLLAVIVMGGVFTILSEFGLSHPSIIIDYESETEALRIQSQFSLGLLLWIVSFILLGPASMQKGNLIYSLLGVHTAKYSPKIDSEIESIIRSFERTAESIEPTDPQKQISEPKDETSHTGDAFQQLFKNS